MKGSVYICIVKSTLTSITYAQTPSCSSGLLDSSARCTGVDVLKSNINTIRVIRRQRR